MKKLVACAGVFGLLLTDLPKAAFDSIQQDLIIVKLEAYVFQTDALNIIYDYFSNTKSIENYIKWQITIVPKTARKG